MCDSLSGMMVEMSSHLLSEHNSVILYYTPIPLCSTRCIHYPNCNYWLSVLYIISQYTEFLMPE